MQWRERLTWVYGLSLGVYTYLKLYDQSPNVSTQSAGVEGLSALLFLICILSFLIEAERDGVVNIPPRIEHAFVVALAAQTLAIIKVLGDGVSINWIESFQTALLDATTFCLWSIGAISTGGILRLFTQRRGH